MCSLVLLANSDTDEQNDSLGVTNDALLMFFVNTA